MEILPVEGGLELLWTNWKVLLRPNEGILKEAESLAQSEAVSQGGTSPLTQSVPLFQTVCGSHNLASPPPTPPHLFLQ